MTLLALFTYGTLVQVYAPIETIESKFYQCNMEQGVISGYNDNNPKNIKYTVDHDCKLDYHMIRAEYPEGKLRAIGK